MKNFKIVLVPAIIKVKPKSYRTRIIKKYHDDAVWSGHPGTTRLLKKIKRQYLWKNMTRNISRYVKACSECQSEKSGIKLKELLISLLSIQ